MPIFSNQPQAFAAGSGDKPSVMSSVIIRCKLPLFRKVLEGREMSIETSFCPAEAKLSALPDKHE